MLVNGTSETGNGGACLAAHLVDPTVDHAVDAVIHKFNSDQYGLSDLQSEVSTMFRLTLDQRTQALFQLIEKSKPLLNGDSKSLIWRTICRITDQLGFQPFKQKEFSDQQCKLLLALINNLQEVALVGTEEFNHTYYIVQNCLDNVPKDQLAPIFTKMMNDQWAQNISTVKGLLLDSRMDGWLDRLKEMGVYAQDNLEFLENLMGQWMFSLKKTAQEGGCSETYNAISEKVQSILKDFYGGSSFELMEGFLNFHTVS